jgi:AbrB family looped-hinge helix DNA binding protein
VSTVTLSPKFQIVIPQALRAALGLRPGEKFQVISYDDRIELIPVRTMKQSRGFLKGMDRKIERTARKRAL